MNCKSCGTVNVEVAKFCYLCGCRIDDEINPPSADSIPIEKSCTSANISQPESNRKYLSSALILAIIPGGLWTWCYTYQKDYLKVIGAFLWLLLTGSTGVIEGFLYSMMFVNVFAIWDVIVTKKTHYYKNYYISEQALYEASLKALNIMPETKSKPYKADPRFAHLIPTADMLPDNPFHNYPLFPKKEKEGPSFVRKAANTATGAYLSYKVVSKL